MIDIDALEALAKAALSRGEEDCESLDDWLSADEFMANMLLHPIDARFAEAMTPATILALIAELRALRTRLEIDPRHSYDGIYCRDETIRHLEDEVRALREDKARLDYLDCMNDQLNKFYATTYQWKVILSPNIVRLTAGRQWAGYVGDIDLNDAQCGEGSFESCREAIDAARKEKA